MKLKSAWKAPVEADYVEGGRVVAKFTPYMDGGVAGSGHHRGIRLAKHELVGYCRAVKLLRRQMDERGWMDLRQAHSYTSRSA